jgi:hypothetical protein
MKKDELKTLCNERKIKGISGKNKEELIEMITQRDATPVSAPKNEEKTDVSKMNYSKKTIPELKVICKERKIEGISGKRKQALIDLIKQSESEPKSPSTNKTEYTSKMKCTICKQEGHNKRSCKTMTTPVSAPKNEAKTDIKATAPVKVEPEMNSSITREDAEKSATEWLGESPSLMRDWLVSAIMDRKQHRDIGKVLAYVSEIHVNKWLSEKSGRHVKNVTGESWDGITDDDKKKVRNQIKFRMDAWHFETTRRNSAKNAETNGTGHVAYRKDEFDMVAIFKPSPTFGITGSTIRCIPVSALINPAKPDQLITSIPMAIRKIYDNEENTLEVIKTLYQIPL